MYEKNRRGKGSMRAKRALGKVNWTKYFLNLAPRNLHAYFSNDPLVAVNKTSIQVIDKILRTTPEKVIVNYTILSYVVTFIEFFSDKYQQIFQNLLPKFPSKADFCFKTTYNGFRDALIAEYARRTNGSEARKVVESMRKELTEEFANIIHKNTWLNADQKNGLISKVKSISFLSAYHDYHLNEAEIDSMYSDYIRIEGFEKLPFLMQEDIFRSIAQKEQFNLLNDTVDLDKKRQTDQAYKNAGAYYSGGYHSIVVTPSLLRFPTYGVTFPR
ncbi:hypothetical protein Y032_0139g2145 [Ancylostoma ceylanicum]|uniref:Peptidase M13 N-terminal domain-containing protein n=2 Tax=Ancylostoma ceylanicum TaxID=53326 RepID=A0A016T3W7_9BILA|nr:hypothetical protein Y032_0139g2145 [Ancylostoma ceylanicum]